MIIYFWQGRKLIAELRDYNMIPRIGDTVKIDSNDVKVMNVIWCLRDDSIDQHTPSSYIRVELEC